MSVGAVKKTSKLALPPAGTVISDNDRFAIAWPNSVLRMGSCPTQLTGFMVILAGPDS